MQLHKALSSGNLHISRRAVEETTARRHGIPGEEAADDHRADPRTDLRAARARPPILLPPAAERDPGQPPPVTASAANRRRPAIRRAGTATSGKGHADAIQRVPAGRKIPFWTVVAMIELLIAAIAFIAVVALVVGILDASRAPRWRRVARERRREWEQQTLQLHRGGEPDTAEWDDD
jgi:hypothetical protein